MHDIETFMFFKWFFKAFVAVFLVTHTFDITMAVFDMAQHIVSGAAGVIGGDTNIDVTEALAAMQEGLKDMEIPELLLLVLKCAQETGAIVTAENHSVYGGLGAAVAEFLGENDPTVVERIGTRDEFGEVGSEAYLRERFGFTPEKIAERVKEAIAKKKD